MTTRASIYCRISRDRAGAGLGVASQEADCRRLAESLGWQIVDVHTDNDLSAYSGKPRPGYRAMLAGIREGRTDAVVAWHTDRLHRSPVELEEYVTACLSSNVKTQTVQAGHIDLSTASGLMVARMLGATARYEVDHSIERQKRAKQRSAEAGKWKGGRRPFGFEADGTTVRGEEAEALAEAVTSMLAGTSLRSLVARWNDRGLRTTSGNQWVPRTLRTVLLRPRNAGLMEHQGKIIGKAQWPAIVSEQRWRALVDMLANPNRRTNVGMTARKWLGSNLYVCECGSKVICSTSNGAHVYRCRDGCGRLSRRQAEVDELVSAVVVARLRKPDVADLLKRDDGGQLEALESEAVALRARLDALAGLFASGAIDAEQLAEGSRTLRRRQDDVRAETSTVFSGTALAGVADAPDPGSAWLDAPLDRQRAVLDALATVMLLRGAAGRPAGWVPGNSYFRPELVEITWRTRT